MYGTTNFGGHIGGGTVFELTPNANDQWTEKVVYSFLNNGKGGYNPLFGLVFDTAGNLYGTTSGGGRFSHGTVFELSPGANGQWTEKVLYAFDSSDGAEPASGLIMDSNGNLYGNTNTGGANDLGTVFAYRLVRAANGKRRCTASGLGTMEPGPLAI